jgi:hypothetical protein
VDYIQTGLGDISSVQSNPDTWDPTQALNEEIGFFDPTIDGMFSTDMDWVSFAAITMQIYH